MSRENKTVVAALVVAAGSGVRMGGAMPKQFIEIANKPILQHTLERFQHSAAIDQVYVILSPEYVDEYAAIIENNWRISKLVKVVAGGAERHLSVWAGLQNLSKDVEIVLIHDGVRPFVSEQIIDASIKSAVLYGAAVVGVPPKDTVKQVEGDVIGHTLDRKTLLLAQTPQTFRKNIILKANEQAFADNAFSTDDAALVERMGRQVAIVPGEWKNIKITSPEDLVVAKAFLEMSA